MSSPFPGMDPYLECDKLWPAFQNQLAHCLYQMLLPGLMDRYRARISQRHYITEQALFTSVVRDEHLEQYIEIRQRSDGKMVTVVDILSPANKTNHSGQLAYLNKRRECRTAHCNIVEIDLVLQGQSPVDYARDGMPDWDYAVTVTRATQPERYEVYTATLQKRLPRFRLPLASDDRDTVIDLQAAFARTYDQGDFVRLINYAQDPPTRLSDSQREWLDERLREQKLRS